MRRRTWPDVGGHVGGLRRKLGWSAVAVATAAPAIGLTGAGQAPTDTGATRAVPGTLALAKGSVRCAKEHLATLTILADLIHLAVIHKSPAELNPLETFGGGGSG